MYRLQLLPRRRKSDIRPTLLLCIPNAKIAILTCSFVTDFPHHQQCSTCQSSSCLVWQRLMRIASQLLHNHLDVLDCSVNAGPCELLHCLFQWRIKVTEECFHSLLVWIHVSHVQLRIWNSHILDGENIPCTQQNNPQDLIWHDCDNKRFTRHHVSGVGEARHFKFGIRIDVGKSHLMDDEIPAKGRGHLLLEMLNSYVLIPLQQKQEIRCIDNLCRQLTYCE